ncbi:hypothetical protein [Pseudomonas sp. Snoq117.2]|uniref:hypothetical protein n=1 Tax=Pseudomonas sp. Snoq117.2 TaxID=1500302 RepID=UPI001160D6C3|nr:hypothetical protein [Pseudomonas sp. Snoq117.2]
MIKPEKPWPRCSGDADGCWQDRDRIDIPVKGWGERPSAPPPPPTVEYAFRTRLAGPGERPSAGAIWQMLAVIAVSVTIGIYIGRHIAGS